MHSIKFIAGTHIDSAAQQLCQAAVEHGEATGKFNDIELHAVSGYAPGAVVSYFLEESARRSQAYRNSPEGKADAEKSDKALASLQARHDQLMAHLPSLDWMDKDAVLAWLCEMQPCTDRVGVIVRRKTIIEAFEKHGFKANENTGADYKNGDRTNMFRYLVGQCLAGLKEGPAIHPIIHKFAAEWHELAAH